MERREYTALPAGTWRWWSCGAQDAGVPQIAVDNRAVPGWPRRRPPRLTGAPLLLAQASRDGVRLGRR